MAIHGSVLPLVPAAAAIGSTNNDCQAHITKKLDVVESQLQQVTGEGAAAAAGGGTIRTTAPATRPSRRRRSHRRAHAPPARSAGTGGQHAGAAGRRRRAVSIVFGLCLVAHLGVAARQGALLQSTNSGSSSPSTGLRAVPLSAAVAAHVSPLARVSWRSSDPATGSCTSPKVVQKHIQYLQRHKHYTRIRRDLVESHHYLKASWAELSSIRTAIAADNPPNTPGLVCRGSVISSRTSARLTASPPSAPATSPTARRAPSDAASFGGAGACMQRSPRADRRATRRASRF
mmetsp:Transcript_31452/g.91962  ORF Transcript_31452/g.91962 Transcript_31452/m.91962 type:complete len:289 (-) Transcript_31452:270-1136(-)